MGSLLKFIELIFAVFKAVQWTVTEGAKKLDELAASKRQRDVDHAIADASAAKKREEKIKAACELEKKINPSSDCDSHTRD